MHTQKIKKPYFNQLWNSIIKLKHKLLKYNYDKHARKPTTLVVG